MALKFSMILEAVDRLTKPVRGAQRSVSALKVALGPTARALDGTARSMEAVERRAQRLRRVAAGRFLQLVEPGAAGAGRQMLTAARGARTLAHDLLFSKEAGDRLARSLGYAGRKLGGFARDTARYAVYGGTALATLAAVSLFRTAGQFEQFAIVLENIEGSAEKGRRALEWVQEFAQKTPYELADVMEAFVQLKAFGIDPQAGALRTLGNASAGMAKPLMQAVEMLADARTGEFERLKEFGIKARKEGGKISFAYAVAGKDIVKTSRDNGAEIEKTILGIFDERFGGMMERQSQSFFGIGSNLLDWWAKFQLMIADAGVFDKIKVQAQRLLEKVEELAENGTLQKWADTISDRLGKMIDQGIDFAENTDWEQVASDAADIAKAVWDTARALAWAAKQAEPLVRLLNRLQQVAPVTSPLTGAVRAYDYFFGGGKPAAPADAPAPARRARPTAAPARAIDPRFFKSTPSSLARPSAAAQPLRIGGQAKIEVEVKGPGRAKIRSASRAGDLLWSLKLGQSMAAAA